MDPQQRMLLEVVYEALDSGTFVYIDNRFHRIFQNKIH